MKRLYVTFYGAALFMLVIMLVMPTTIQAQDSAGAYQKAIDGLGYDGEFPSDMRYIGKNGTTSDCIGSNYTAICALETYLACRALRDIELCKVSIEEDRWLPFWKRNYESYYRIKDAIIYDSSKNHILVNKVPIYQEGNVRIIVDHFWEDGAQMDGYAYIVMPSKKGWFIASWDNLNFHDGGVDGNGNPID